MYWFLILVFGIDFIFANNYSIVNLHPDHLATYFDQFPDSAEVCEQDEDCPFQNLIQNTNKCWGYEQKCSPKNRYSNPICTGRSADANSALFYKQGDFGYIQDQLQQLKMLCNAFDPNDSSLECTNHLRFCRGRNILVNFDRMQRYQSSYTYLYYLYTEEPNVKLTEISGYCQLYGDQLRKESDELKRLESWGPELVNFKTLDNQPIIKGECDAVIGKTSFIMKLDATYNMYHHFLDFFNLYLSLHLHSDKPGKFSTDINIIVTSERYSSVFGNVFKVFSHNTVWDVNRFRGKTVCFKKLIFPLLPNMIDGIYFNTPLAPDCKSSGLVNAFSKHVLYRMNIPQNPRQNAKVRITFIARRTKVRLVVNEEQLMNAINKNSNYDVQLVIFEKDLTFEKQLEISRNTDVLIGIHGAGLTHLLFMPEWGVVFELYDCQDPCYFDLTRLRGLNHITWEDNSTVTEHEPEDTPKKPYDARFSNYSFDVNEFIRLVKKAVKMVEGDRRFREYLAQFFP